MSGSKFWVGGLSRRQESEPAHETLIRSGLTSVDRCDRCAARAYLRVLLPNGLELLFCVHHARQHASALAKVAVEIHDETELQA